MPQRKRSTSRRDEIVETALSLAAKYGIEAVSMQVIADEIGVTQPAIFRHFKTKEDLWLAVMDWLEEQILTIFRSSEQKSGDAKAVLRAMFMQHVALIESHPALAKVVFSDGLRLGFPSVQKRFKAIHEEYMARLIKLVRGEHAAMMFLCLIQGLAFQFAIARVSRDVHRDAEAVFRLYLRGIAAK